MKKTFILTAFTIFTSSLFGQDSLKHKLILIASLEECYNNKNQVFTFKVFENNILLIEGNLDTLLNASIEVPINSNTKYSMQVFEKGNSEIYTKENLYFKSPKKSTSVIRELYVPCSLDSEIHLPEIVYSSDTSITFGEKELNYFIEIMKNNPTIVMQIEIFKSDISSKRFEYLKSTLLDKGINLNRLIFIRREDIDKNKIRFKIIAYDYKSNVSLRGTTSCLVRI